MHQSGGGGHKHFALARLKNGLIASAPAKLLPLPAVAELNVTGRGWCSDMDRIVNSGIKLLNRREFNGICAAFGSFVTLSGASALDAAGGVPSNGGGRTVRLPDGTVVPALGQGSAGLAKGRHPQAEEEEALRTGISLAGRSPAESAIRPSWVQGSTSTTRWALPAQRGLARPTF